jgi:hypothetical protein
LPNKYFLRDGQVKIFQLGRFIAIIGADASGGLENRPDNIAVTVTIKPRSVA